MQFTLKRLFVFLTCSAAGVGCCKLAANNWEYSLIQIPFLALATGAWGLGLGALMNCPWRGFAIGFLTLLAFAFVYGYFGNS
jgi:hypothetical protein